MRIGDIEVLPVWDGLTSEPADTMLMRPGTRDPWVKFPGCVDKRGHLNFVIGGFLIRTEDRVVLVDTGVGTISNGHHSAGHFIDSLGTHGVNPEDVTDVLFTHLHFDHVGWATQQGKVTFPNAIYRAHVLDWAHFVDAPDAQEGARRKLTPLISRLELFSEDRTLVPGVGSRHCPGHTPGHTSFVVSSGGRRAYLLGDTVHSVVELAERDWVPLRDLDQQTSIDVRNAIADEVVDTDAILVASHFPGMRFGRLVTKPEGRRFVPV
jgi:glyoxylase-like metal-dependent hydrolase (beta-lactamase superfamily II)